MTVNIVSHLRTSAKELEKLTGGKSFETTLMIEAADQLESLIVAAQAIVDEFDRYPIVRESTVEALRAVLLSH